MSARTDEVRIRYYGMFDITKRRYVSIQAVVLVVTVFLTALTFSWRPSGVLGGNFLFVNLPWFFLLILIMEVVEAFVMMRKFRDAETARVRGGAKPF